MNPTVRTGSLNFNKVMTFRRYRFPDKPKLYSSLCKSGSLHVSELWDTTMVNPSCVRVYLHSSRSTASGTLWARAATSGCPGRVRRASLARRRARARRRPTISFRREVCSHKSGKRHAPNMQYTAVVCGSTWFNGKHTIKKLLIV